MEQKTTVDLLRIGLKDYKEVWDLQEQIFQQISDRKAGKPTPDGNNKLILVQHPHVYTLGRNGTENNLLINDNFLKTINATYYKINRGGDITYHGPGQWVGYPIVDLDQLKISIKEYIFRLEQTIIETIAHYGLLGQRLDKATGVWLDIDQPTVRKICALGVRTGHWITMHGFALNVNTDLSYFNHINPCGFQDKGVTSLQKELGKKIDEKEVEEIIVKNFAKVFDVEVK